MKPTKQQVRELRKRNADFPEHLIAVPAELWSAETPINSSAASVRVGVLRSRDFLVQVFEQGETLRLSVNRTDWDENLGRWKENITWDDLQRLKRAAGFADFAAVEIFPPDEHVVNVANMRHLFLLKTPPKFMWVKSNG